MRRLFRACLAAAMLTAGGVAIAQTAPAPARPAAQPLLQPPSQLPAQFQPPSQFQSQFQPRPIDVRLMDKAEADRSRGCTIALWQANRDPDRDRYAFLFIEQLAGPNHARQPARIKVGDQMLPLRRVAIGGRSSGYGLHEFQLYKLPGEDDFAILELRLGPIEGEAVTIEGGTLSIMMRGRQHFRGNVKGSAGCATAPVVGTATAEPGAPAARQGVQTAALSKMPPPRTFRRYQVRSQDLSRAFLDKVRQSHGCHPEYVRQVGVTGYQLSENSAIWDIPCEAFAFQTSSVLALVSLASPGDSMTVARLDHPAGRTRDLLPGVLMSSTWDVARRVVTGVSLGRAGGDCGTLERHRVREDGSFELVELRVKSVCDGRVTRPDEFPLVFRAR